MGYTNFIVYINGEPTTFGEFNSAREYWLLRTFQCEKGPAGGIAIQEFNSEGNMTHDGWLLHVQENGVVFVSSQLTFNG